MRIISGSARGRKLATFTGHDIRPTPDRVREAVFSKIASRLGSFNGLQVLDIFAGSGAMGIEALSRGASGAVFVDRGRQACQLVENNLSACKLADQALLLCREAVQSLGELSRRNTKFDLVFLDPPYAQDLVEPTLNALVSGDLLTGKALVVAESDDKDSRPESIAGLDKVDSRHYGRTRIELYTPMVER